MDKFSPLHLVYAAETNLQPSDTDVVIIYQDSRPHHSSICIILGISSCIHRAFLSILQLMCGRDRLEQYMTGLNTTYMSGLYTWHK
jgi:hypothetical protein